MILWINDEGLIVLTIEVRDRAVFIHFSDALRDHYGGLQLQVIHLDDHRYSRTTNDDLRYRWKKFAICQAEHLEE